MHNTQAKQIKWDLVDHLLCNYAESEATSNYTQDEREYANSQIRRIARMLGVTDHIYL